MAKETFDFFDIDQNMLDREWVMQPKIFFTYARKLANARRQVEEAKAELDVVKAELDKAVREEPEKYGLEKTTEASIASAVITQPTYKQAQQSLITIKHKADVMQAAVNALDHRKSALERLVSLHGQNYFSKPQASGVDADEAKQSLQRNRLQRSRKKATTKKAGK